MFRQVLRLRDGAPQYEQPSRTRVCGNLAWTPSTRPASHAPLRQATDHYLTRNRAWHNYVAQR